MGEEKANFAKYSAFVASAAEIRKEGQIENAQLKHIALHGFSGNLNLHLLTGPTNSC